MTREEEKIIEALKIMEIKPDHEISKDELKRSYLHLAKMYHPDSMNPEYENGEMFSKMKDAYDYLYDHEDLLHETVHNILNPGFETHQYSWSTVYEEKEEPKREEKSEAKPEGFQQIHLVDRPSIFSIILSFLSPIIGIMLYFFERKILPKASKAYLFSGLTSIVLSLCLMIFL